MSNAPATPSIPATSSRPLPVRSVSQCGLTLVQVRLSLLVCTPGDKQNGGAASLAEVKCKGEVVEGSLTPAGFDAAVAWSLAFPEGEKTPIAITGRHELSFSVTEAVSRADAEYYAEVNAIILVYPYLRHLIDDLSAKSLGRSIMVRPLDVPRFVAERTQALNERRRAEELAAEAQRDGETVT